MNAGGPYGIVAADAVFRVRKISRAQQLYGERDANDDADRRAPRDTPRPPASRSGTEQSAPVRHGLWRHAPFVAQIIGQILPSKDKRERLMSATYDNKTGAVAAVIDTKI